MHQIIDRILLLYPIKVCFRNEDNYKVTLQCCLLLHNPETHYTSLLNELTNSKSSKYIGFVSLTENFSQRLPVISPLPFRKLIQAKT